MQPRGQRLETDLIQEFVNQNTSARQYDSSGGLVCSNCFKGASKNPIISSLLIGPRVANLSFMKKETSTINQLEDAQENQAILKLLNLEDFQSLPKKRKLTRVTSLFDIIATQSHYVMLALPKETPQSQNPELDEMEYLCQLA